MTLDTFFKKFEIFADAPDAVAKMRALVLDLAVQGRLVPQDPRDEPAVAMLERISSTAKTRRSGSGDPDAFDEPFQIPTGWEWVRLPRVLNKLTDGTHHSPPNGPSGDFMYVTAKNIKTDGVLLDGITYVTKDVHEEIYSRCDPSYGDVLYIKDGATTGIATINQVKEPFSMLSSVALLKPSAAIFNRYLLWAMRSPFFYAETRGAMKGAAITRVTLSVMAASLLPLPPLAEQKRIVVKVDELMALCDRLEVQQQEREAQHALLARAALARFADAPTPANLDFLFHKSYAISPADLRKSILTLAVQGRLVSQNPNDEPAESVLDRIAVLRGQFSTGKRAKAAKRVRDIDISKCSYDLPDSWTWCRLGDLVLDFRYGTSRKCDRKASGVPVLRIPNIQNGRIDFTDLKFTSMPAAEFKELSLQKGDLLLVRSNGSENLVGRSAVACAGDERFAYAGYLVRARLPENEVFASFLHVALSTPAVRDQIEGPIRTTSGVKNINTTELSNLVVPLPPLAEQRRIVAKVDQLMALVDALETQLADSRAAAANLLSAMVGELTGTASGPKFSARATSGTGRRGRPRKAL